MLYADTRQELPPLHNAAIALMENLREREFDTRVVLPQLDHRYFVYMLGRGVPLPSNVFRWCTPKLKVMSMERELEALREERGDKFLMLTGVRIGESAARDQRIAMSCTKDGGEYGQGWFQHWEVKKSQYRLRQHGEVRKDGTLAKKQGRLGPLTLETREWMLGKILRVQDEVNAAAENCGQPTVKLINDEELARIQELIAAKTWPEKWDGTEHRGDEWLPDILPDGSVQPLPFGNSLK